MRKYIYTVVSEDEHARMSSLAADDGKTVAQFVRDSINRRLGESCQTLLEERVWGGYRARRHVIEKEAVLAALDASGGCRKLAAKRLGIARQTLFRRMRQYGLPTIRTGGQGRFGRPKEFGDDSTY